VLVAVFRQVRGTLSDRGTFWLNIGDSYTRQGELSRDAATEVNPAAVLQRNLVSAPRSEAQRIRDAVDACALGRWSGFEECLVVSRRQSWSRAVAARTTRDNSAGSRNLTSP
jgi:hypothetical protein